MYLWNCCLLEATKIEDSLGRDLIVSEESILWILRTGVGSIGIEEKGNMIPIEEDKISGGGEYQP